ncbi:hypothetical protein, partial [uncultured Parasphingopyxis sp.]|uniref:beta strand repeat-containing protein n=1 Tax=uncultured Parasphingopyxis sp. TaxID=1547918 RepID=UPI00262D696B
MSNTIIENRAGKIVKAAGRASVLLGLLASAAPVLAQQSVPGADPDCPIVNGVATCTGDVSGGITSGPGDPSFSVLNVENLTAPIAPNGYFAIGVVKNDSDIAINIADDVVIDVFDDPNIAGVAQGLIAIVDQGFDLTIDTGAAITADGNGSFGLGIEAVVSNGDGDLAITNRGTITAFTDFQSAIALQGRQENSTGAIDITNSGVLSATSGGTGERNLATSGILARHFLGGNDITIGNSGAITVATGPDTTDTDFDGIGGGIVSNMFGDAGATRITNSGAIMASGPFTSGIVGFARHDTATGTSLVTVQNSGDIAVDGVGGYGILAQGGGNSVNTTVENSGDIAMTSGAGTLTGIFALSQTSEAAIRVNNEAGITGSGALLRALGASTFGAPAGGTYDIGVFNQGAIAFDAPAALGITVFATRDDTVDADVVNDGDIDLSGTTDAGSIGISVDLNAIDANAGSAIGSSIARIVNSGDIMMGAGTGILVTAQDIAVTNRGAITTTGDDSDGIVVDASDADDWQVLVDDAGSVTTGGAGSAAIRVTGTTDDYLQTLIHESTARVTVNKARMADRAQNAITDYINSVEEAPFPPGGADGESVVVNGVVRSDGGAGAIVSEGALRIGAANPGAVIATTGDDNPAISAQGALSLQASDRLVLSSTGDNSPLFQLAAGGLGTPGDSASGVVVVDIEASTTGDNSTAFQLDSGGGNSVGNLEVYSRDAMAPSTITTGGDGSHAVRFVAPNGGSAFTGQIYDSLISTAGNGSLALNLDLGGNSSANLAMLDSSVSTGGADSDAIRLGIGGDSDMLLLLQRSTLATTGDGSDAIDIPQVANSSLGNAIIIGSDVSTEGDDARAFAFAELGGDASSRTAFIADSTFATQGDGSTAVLLGAYGNTSTSTTSIFDTTITTAGSNARGIDHGLGGDGSANEITIDNVSVNTTGATNAGAMIFNGTVDDDSAFSISLSNLDLSTLGSDSDGLFIGGGGSGSSVFSTDSASLTIATQGDNSRGFVVDQFIAGDGSTTVGDMFNITVTTQGASAHGIWIGTSADGSMVNSSTAFSAVNLDIATQGDSARGFYFAGLTGDMTDSDFTLLLRDSNISTAGADAIGLELGGTEGDVTDSDKTVALSNLDITTAGAGAHGLVIGPNLDDFAVSDDLAYDDIVVATSGAEAHALYLRDGAQFSVTEDNNLSLDATGIGSFEAYVGDGANLAILSGSLRRADMSFARVLLDGGILSGNGTVGSVTSTGGTLAPGESIGTLIVRGNLSFDANSFYQVEVNDLSESDRVIVFGAVDLGGATLDIIESGAFAGGGSFNYIIIDNDGADAINGVFGDIQNDFAFLTPSVSYTGGDGNDVLLTLTPNNTPPPVDDCIREDRTLICTGDQSDGIAVDDSDAVDALVVRDLTTDVDMTGTNSAITFGRSTGPVSISADETVTITTMGRGVDGIQGRITSTNSTADLSIVANVDTITSGGSGIFAINRGSGYSSVTFSGTIVTDQGSGIYLSGSDGGDATVEFTSGLIDQLEDNDPSRLGSAGSGILVDRNLGPGLNTVSIAGDIINRQVNGPGIFVQNIAGGRNLVSQTGGTIRTIADGSPGILAEGVTNSQAGNEIGQLADIMVSGEILTEGARGPATNILFDDDRTQFLDANGILLAAFAINPGDVLNGGTNPTANIEITETGRIFTENSAGIALYTESFTDEDDTFVPIPVDVTLTVAGEIARADGADLAIDLWDGNDTIVVRTGGLVDGSIATGAGSDIVTLPNGTVTGTVDLGAGNDQFNLTALTSTIVTDGGAGMDRAVYATAAGSDDEIDLNDFAFTSIERFLQFGTGTLRINEAGSVFDSYQVSVGQVLVNADQSAVDFLVQNFARLGGTGTVGNLTLNTGTLAPGASIGTLTVNGDLVLDAASTFEVEVDDMGNGDLAIVNGSVTLGGATLNVLETGDFAGDDPFNYLIIDNDGSDAVTGTFGT